MDKVSIKYSVTAIPLSHPSLICFSHFPSVSSIALRAVGLTNFSIPTPAASLSKLCLWIPHQTEPHYKAPYHSSFKCLTVKGKIRSCGVLVLKPDYWSGALMVDITMEMKQKKGLINISLHIQFGSLSSVVLNLVQFIIWYVVIWPISEQVQKFALYFTVRALPMYLHVLLPRQCWIIEGDMGWG